MGTRTHGYLLEQDGKKKKKKKNPYPKEGVEWEQGIGNPLCRHL